FKSQAPVVPPVQVKDWVPPPIVSLSLSSPPSVTTFRPLLPPVSASREVPYKVDVALAIVGFVPVIVPAGEVMSVYVPAEGTVPRETVEAVPSATEVVAAIWSLPDGVPRSNRRSPPPAAMVNVLTVSVPTEPSASVAPGAIRALYTPEVSAAAFSVTLPTTPVLVPSPAPARIPLVMETLPALGNLPVTATPASPVTT